MLVNIISNAIKFSPANSTVTISLSQGTISNLPAILITLTDKGIGVPERDLETIFDKFTQSNSAKNENEGTALGPSIAKSIILKHMGKIWAENAPKQGTVIKILLPITIPSINS